MSILRRRREQYETCFSTLGLNREFVNNVINFLRSYTFSQVNTHFYNLNLYDVLEQRCFTRQICYYTSISYDLYLSIFLTRHSL